ncbi:GMP reductase [Mycoplasma marinum]|uniref:GMP reductase n=1 Tax=Mycoplasma marinum TaxID=1937190 RepID=A0A4R0XT53_9MOLU|nr:GMP reductase [Mycoplasma marinum]TCG10917.1 GMP reductase [Mycoplasma marinum]
MKVFDYEDVQLLPKRCIVKSRSECDTTVILGKHKFKLPIVPANMITIINEELAIEFALKGYFYVMHRFDFDNIAFVKKMKDKKLISSISVGVQESHFKEIETLSKNNTIPEYITIDIAHGHAKSVKLMIRHIRKHMGDKTFVIAGNVATPEAVTDLERWGADATKVGVGPGKVCITKLKTGFGTAGWQLSAVNMCSKAATKPIIADGGVRHNGDLAKSIRFGATMSMAGSILSGHIESPGKTVVVDGKEYKEYFGSASEFNKGEKKHVEGKKELVPTKGSIWDTLTEMEQDLQSSISYAGGKEINAIKKVKYVLVKSNEGF